MEFDSKSYKIYKTKQYLKQNRFFFILNGINRNSYDWTTLTEQTLKNKNFHSYKNFNKITKKTLNNSTYKNAISIVKGSTFFIKSTNKKYKLAKQILTNNFEKLFFVILAIKLNNKSYSSILLKSLEYKKNATIMYHSKIIHLKYFIKLSK